MKFPTIPVAELLRTGEAEVKTGPFGTQLKASDYVSEGTPVINVRNIGFGNIREEKLEYIGKETVQRLASHLLRPEDIVFGRKGAVERHVFIQSGQSNWFQGSDCLRLRLSSGRLFPRFVSYYLLTHEHQQWMMSQCSHGATMASLNQDIISRIQLPCPPVDTQRRIASILSAYDDLIENNTRRIAILEEMARRIYEEWFVRFRFPGHEQVRMVESELGLIPEGWAVESLGNVCSRLQSGGTPSRSNDGYWHEGTVDWYKTKELWDGFLFNSEEKITELAVLDKKTRVFEAGVILMAIYGSPTVGRFGITTRRCACNQAALGIEPDTERITKWFLVHTLYSLRQEFNNKAQGAAQQNISKEKVAETKFVLPSMTTLSGFESLVSPMWEMLLNLQKKNLNLRTTRDLLLPKLISGELDVSTLPEPEEAIAA